MRATGLSLCQSQRERKGGRQKGHIIQPPRFEQTVHLHNADTQVPTKRMDREREREGGMERECTEDREKVSDSEL